MLNELPLYNDLQALLKDYAKALEDAMVPHVLDAFPNIQDIQLGILECDEWEITASVVIDDITIGEVNITQGLPLPVRLQLGDNPYEMSFTALDTTDILRAWNNYTLAQKYTRFVTTEYYRSQLSDITPYLIRFQSHVKDFPVSYHAITVHVINGQSVMQSIMASMLGSAQSLHPNSAVTQSDIVLLGVLPYNKMAREYYTIDQWGYSIKPEALTVYARELLNVPVDL